jgi:hypothetical protein
MKVLFEFGTKEPLKKVRSMSLLLRRGTWRVWIWLRGPWTDWSWHQNVWGHWVKWAASKKSKTWNCKDAWLIWRECEEGEEEEDEEEEEEEIRRQKKKKKKSPFSCPAWVFYFFKSTSGSVTTLTAGHSMWWGKWILYINPYPANVDKMVGSCRC